MPRRLLLLRHAKSSWADPSLDDFDRPLAPRGIRAAPCIGRFMRAHDLAPALVLCSAARRTRETWTHVAPELSSGIPVRILRSLYEASPDRLLSAVRKNSDQAAPLLVIGHNPGLEQFALRLAGLGSSSADLGRLRRKFPTAALAVLELDIDRWADLAPGIGRLTVFIRPKDLN